MRIDADEATGYVHTSMNGIRTNPSLLSGDPDEASDATQEILLRVFKGISSFCGGSSFRTLVLPGSDQLSVKRSFEKEQK
jgi:hypothetical protein